jgi:hypothetical protein
MDQSVLAHIARSSPRYAAVMPDDAFDGPDPTLGPALLGSRGRTPTRASYSLYYLAPQENDGHAAKSRMALTKELAERLIADMGSPPPGSKAESK